MISIIRNYAKNKISNKYINHGTLIELIWTVTPALILILIAFPSFKLLYLMDEVTDPNLTVFAEGHQWYWSYQYPDFLSDDNEKLEFDSYIVDESHITDYAMNELSEAERGRLFEFKHTRIYTTVGEGGSGDSTKFSRTGIILLKDNCLALYEGHGKSVTLEKAANYGGNEISYDDYKGIRAYFRVQGHSRPGGKIIFGPKDLGNTLEELYQAATHVDASVYH